MSLPLEDLGAISTLGDSRLAQPTTIGACATLACIWEATAAKPGNVYRGADFDDVTYADFLTSAVVIGPAFEKAHEQCVGNTVLEAAQATQAAVKSNTNLGMVLLMAPLAAVPSGRRLVDGIKDALISLTVEDTRRVYEAIRLANPGGLGAVSEADVRQPTPDITLPEAMRLAADRDLVALQYVNGFEQVFHAADLMEHGANQGWSLNDVIVWAFLSLLSEFPDSLIARKCGGNLAQETSIRAAAVLATGSPREAQYHTACRELDFWLRADGHRRNPGTSADLVAAGLFVLLRDQRLNWPIDFYGTQ